MKDEIQEQEEINVEGGGRDLRSWKEYGEGN